MTNKSEHLKVLSIDWDFFIDADEKTRSEMFPDGGNENLPQFIMDFIWSNRYASNPALENISVDQCALDRIKNIVDDLNIGHLWIVDSHKHIYDAIAQLHRPGQEIDIVNIDFHHDCYDHNEDKVDCGNWVLQVLQNGFNKVGDGQYLWVYRPGTEDPAEGIGYTGTFNDQCGCNYLDRLQPSESKVCWDWEDVDLLFICRSSMWSPPHLDDQFIEFCEFAQSRYSGMSYIKEVNIDKSRYSEEFQESIEQQRQQLFEMFQSTQQHLDD